MAVAVGRMTSAVVLLSCGAVVVVVAVVFAVVVVEGAASSGLWSLSDTLLKTVEVTEVKESVVAVRLGLGGTGGRDTVLGRDLGRKITWRLSLTCKIEIQEGHQRKEYMLRENLYNELNWY